MEEKIERTLLSFKIISRTKEYEKLSINQKQLEIDTNSIFQCIIRWYTENSRGKIISFINNVVKDAIDITNNIISKEMCSDDIENNYIGREKKHFNDENSRTMKKFLFEMINAVKGLENLKITYKDDILTVSKLDLIIEKINARIEKINKLLLISV